MHKTSVINKIALFSFIIIFFFPKIVTALTEFECEKILPQQLQVPGFAECNQGGFDMPVIDKKELKNIESYIVTAQMKYNNSGGAIIQFPGQKPKVVYRSANLAGAPLCLQAVTQRGNVSTIINLYAKDTNDNILFSAMESNHFSQFGGAQYIQELQFINLAGNYISLPESKKANIPPPLIKTITGIINTIKNADGNVLIHCEAGEHLTGTIFGVLQKCVNKLPLKMVEDNMMCHLGPIRNEAQKVSKDMVLNLVQYFPCDQLQISAAK